MTSNRRDMHASLPSSRRAAWAVLLLAPLFGCASQPPLPTTPATTVLDAETRFAHAMVDARLIEADEIANDLPLVASGNAELGQRTVDGRWQVRVATWTVAVAFDGPIGASMPAGFRGEPTWVTLVPELQRFCAALDAEERDRRVREHLGLRPENTNRTVVELWVDADQLYRPCSDPRTDVSRCIDEAPASVPFGSETFDAWFARNYAASLENEARPYPWTRLGYTYDWGANTAERGAAEFVIPAGVPVEIAWRGESDAYCR